MTIAIENQFVYQWMRAHQTWRVVEKAANNGRLEITDFLDEAGSLLEEATSNGEKVMIVTCDDLVVEKIAEFAQGHSKWEFRTFTFRGNKRNLDRTLFGAKYHGTPSNGTGMQELAYPTQPPPPYR